MAAITSRTSRINGWEFNAEMGVVHLMNTAGKLGGHAVIVVELVEATGALFVGQYDIRAKVVAEETGIVQSSLGNYQGYISEIKAFSSTDYTRDYSPYASNTRSWLVTAANIQTMIASIMEWRAKVALSLTGAIEPIPYQVAGSKRIGLLGGNSGHNCITWAEEQLILAHIDNGKKLDGIKTSPQLHVKSYCVIL